MEKKRWSSLSIKPSLGGLKLNLVFKNQNRKCKIRKIDLTYLENKAYLVDYSIKLKS